MAGWVACPCGLPFSPLTSASLAYRCRPWTERQPPPFSQLSLKSSKTKVRLESQSSFTYFRLLSSVCLFCSVFHCWFGFLFSLFLLVKGAPGEGGGDTEDNSIFICHSVIHSLQNALHFFSNLVSF